MPATISNTMSNDFSTEISDIIGGFITNFEFSAITSTLDKIDQIEQQIKFSEINFSSDFSYIASTLDKINQIESKLPADDYLEFESVSPDPPLLDDDLLHVETEFSTTSTISNNLRYVRKYDLSPTKRAREKARDYLKKINSGAIKSPKQRTLRYCLYRWQI